MKRPLTTVILAMSADGKIADRTHAAARFGSANDRAHLEQQIAQADAVLFGAGTLRAYGTTLSVRDPTLVQQRQQHHKSTQPIQIVCSRSGKLDPQLRFFRQPVPRWLLTTAIGATFWQQRFEFERILTVETAAEQIDWLGAFQQFRTLGIESIAVLGGGTIVAALLEAQLIDQLWLTVCPLLLGGETAITPVAGTGFLAAIAPRLQLLNARTHDHEVFLHYQVIPSHSSSST
jgi:5-amino-6-(5-phosphoribosylamino)uracil reductase